MERGDATATIAGPIVPVQQGSPEVTGTTGTAIGHSEAESPQKPLNPVIKGSGTSSAVEQGKPLVALEGTVDMTQIVHDTPAGVPLVALEGKVETTELVQKDIHVRKPYS